MPGRAVGSDCSGECIHVDALLGVCGDHMNLILREPEDACGARDRGMRFRRHVKACSFIVRAEAQLSRACESGEICDASTTDEQAGCLCRHAEPVTEPFE